MLAVAVYVALVWFRVPGLVHHPRLWAEEGTIYFVNAWNLPWWEALLRPAVGYLNLAANIAGLLGHDLAPLQHAPDVTLAVAFAIQALPALLLASAKDGWLARPAVLFAAILILAMPPACDEVWLNTPNSQFHIALAAALCLALDVPVGKAGFARAVLLFFAPLSSPASVALVPLFALRAAIERERSRMIQALCIVAGTVLQLVFFYTPMQGRGHFPAPSALAAIVAVKHLILPYFGEQAAAIMAPRFAQTISAGHYPALAILAVLLCLGLLLAAIIAQRRAPAAWLAAAAAALACLSYYGALDGGGGLIDAIRGNRYAFAPSMLLALTVLCIAATPTGRTATLARMAVVWLIAIAIQQTLLPQDGFFTIGPIWSHEIARWRADPTRAVEIWPQGWALHLPPHSS